MHNETKRILGNRPHSRQVNDSPNPRINGAGIFSEHVGNLAMQM